MCQELGTKTKYIFITARKPVGLEQWKLQKVLVDGPSWDVAVIYRSWGSRFRVCPQATKCEKPLQITSFSPYWSEFNLRKHMS